MLKGLHAGERGEDEVYHAYQKDIRTFFLNL